MLKYVIIVLLAASSTKGCNNKIESNITENEVIISENLNEEMESKSTEIERIHDIYVLTSLELEQVDKAYYPAGRPNLEINITENKIMGFSGCNNFFGDIINITESKIELGAVAATKKYCQGVNENIFFEKLNQVNTYKIENLELFLYNNDELLMTFKKVD